MMRAAHELAERHNKAVLVTTTTHLAIDQVALGDRHYTINFPAELEKIVNQNLPGVIIITGDEKPDGRLCGIQGETLLRLKELAGAHEMALLIEADGARLQPLKAPAEHEPA